MPVTGLIFAFSLFLSLNIVRTQRLLPVCLKYSTEDIKKLLFISRLKTYRYVIFMYDNLSSPV